MVCTPIYMEQLDQILIKPSTVIKIEELVKWQLNDKKLNFHETFLRNKRRFKSDKNYALRQ